MTRKEVFRSIVGACVGAAGVATLAACSDEGDPPNPDSAQASCTANGTSVAIGTNHGHTLTVPKEDVMAGAAKTYQIQGTSPHPHSVMVTAAMFTMLQNNQMVMVTSSTDAMHSHQVTITCA